MGRWAGCCRAGQGPRPAPLLERLAAIYPGRLYVELQRHPGREAGSRLPEAEAADRTRPVELAYEMGLPLVATNDVYFPEGKDVSRRMTR